LREYVLLCKGWQENQFYNAKVGEKISFTMHRLARIQVSKCKGWREYKFHNAKAGENISFKMQRLERI
jgi:hypothetical protein